MFSKGLTIQQGVILAAYIFFQTKEHVEGCGGKSHIAILRETSGSGQVDLERIESITSNVSKADLSLGQLLIAASNLELSAEEFRSEADNTIMLLEMHRAEQETELKNWKKYNETIAEMFDMKERTDTFGIYVPLETSDEPASQRDGEDKDEFNQEEKKS
jgi:hypothetical protein